MFFKFDYLNWLKMIQKWNKCWVIFSPWLMKFLKFDYLNWLKIIQKWHKCWVIFSPWLKKFLKFDYLNWLEVIQKWHNFENCPSETSICITLNLYMHIQKLLVQEVKKEHKGAYLWKREHKGASVFRGVIWWIWWISAKVVVRFVHRIGFNLATRFSAFP